MARTPDQIRAFIDALRNTTEYHRRGMDSFNQLKALYTDVGLSNLTDQEVAAAAPGLTAADITGALGAADTLITGYTPAIRAAMNKIGHGAP